VLDLNLRLKFANRLFISIKVRVPESNLFAKILTNFMTQVNKSMIRSNIVQISAKHMRTAFEVIHMHNEIEN